MLRNVPLINDHGSSNIFSPTFHGFYGVEKITTFSATFAAMFVYYTHFLEYIFYISSIHVLKNVLDLLKGEHNPFLELKFCYLWILKEGIF